jgi:streptogrisin C
LWKVCALLVIVVTMMAPGVAQAESDEALREDAAMLAQAKGLTIEESMHRLRLFDVVGELDARLSAKESATFAGLWIENEPELRVVVQHTGELSEGFSRHLDGRLLAGLVEVRKVPVSLRELEASHAAAAFLVRQIGVAADIDIDVKKNRVKVMVLDSASLEAALSVAKLGLPEHVEIVEVQQLAQPEAFIYGGMAISDCTSGFVVQHSNGTYGILTAAHCNNSQSYSGYNLPYQSQAFYGSYDVQWNSLSSSLMFWPKIKVGGGSRIITATKGRSSQAIGEYICKQGRTTNYRCGTLSSKTFLPNYVPSGNATFMYVSGGSVNLSEPGDSGGPWVKNQTAYGIHSCGIGNDSCYTAIDYTSILGVSVLFWTNPDPSCEQMCDEYLDDCTEEFCYWNYNDYMCGTGCYVEHEECLWFCYDY